ncbi:MAG: TolC family protein [Cytophagales bacterium]|nr:MAG: TolC family protein [Cytophagales bacterium]
MRNQTFMILLATQLILFNNAVAQTNTITSFDEFMTLANTKSLTLKSGEIQLSQAKKAKLASILGILDPTGNVGLSYTNNTQLAVNLIPSEILGGQAGTFKEVKFGVQYNTTFNTNVDIKLINPVGWENFKLAKLNIQLTESSNKIALKNLYDNSATIFFSIATLQEQLKSTKENLAGAEKLYQTTVNKYQAGLVNQQDLNESTINKKTVEEQINQIEFLIQQQYIALKLLSDIPEEVQFSIEPKTQESVANIEVQNNQLLFNNALLNEQISFSNYKKAKYSVLPTFSVFFSSTEQQFNQRAKLFDSNVNWIPSSYVGFRLSMPLPSASSISQSYKAKYDHQLTKNNTEQFKIQSKHTSNQLIVDYEKAISQKTSNKAIYELRKDTYEKNLQNYEAGIISLDQTIRSFNEMVNSQYNLISAEKTVEMALTKININNKIK